jgi:hypothetical protein
MASFRPLLCRQANQQMSNYPIPTHQTSVCGGSPPTNKGTLDLIRLISIPPLGIGPSQPVPLDWGVRFFMTNWLWPYFRSSFAAAGLRLVHHAAMSTGGDVGERLPQLESDNLLGATSYLPNIACFEADNSSGPIEQRT